MKREKRPEVFHKRFLLKCRIDAIHLICCCSHLLASVKISDHWKTFQKNPIFFCYKKCYRYSNNIWSRDFYKLHPKSTILQTTYILWFNKFFQCDFLTGYFFSFHAKNLSVHPAEAFSKGLYNKKNLLSTTLKNCWLLLFIKKIFSQIT